MLNSRMRLKSRHGAFKMARPQGVDSIPDA
uniref:Uncharacterized protein n=1 Tax=Podoviridae sp. ctrub15 TaxID=2826581 RepID=A0A8S5LVD8_9CAUD|nr:MAG TPA: hypothetical protein [Podoviridae sp. ctrub15]